MTIRFKEPYGEFQKGTFFKSDYDSEKFYVDINVAVYVNTIVCIDSLRFPFS